MANPALTSSFKQAVKQNTNASLGERVSVNGVVNKTLMLIAIVAAVAAATAFIVPINLLIPVGFGASILGLIIAMVMIFSKNANPAGAVLYAAVEGVFVGAFSAYFNIIYPDIVTQAVFATFATAALMFFLWKRNIIKVTDGFMRNLTFALFAYLGLSLINLFVFLFTGWSAYFTGLGWLFALIGVVLASLSIAADLQMVTKAVQAGLPEKEEWRLGFGLTVTLVWLYVEFLRLFGLIRE